MGYMATGTIKKITEKGFGFINDGQQDIFFHLSSLDGITFDQLVEGQTVEFESEKSDRGLRAVRVSTTE
jgi:CspA family cold shock protein